MPTIFDQVQVFSTIGNVPIPPISITGQPYGMRVALSKDWFGANPINQVVCRLTLDVSVDDQANWWLEYYNITPIGILRQDRGGNTLWYAWQAQALKSAIKDYDNRGGGAVKVWVRGNMEVMVPFESRIVVDTFNTSQWGDGNAYNPSNLPDVSGG